MKQKINLQLLFIAFVTVIISTIGMIWIYYGLFQKQVQKDLVTCARLLEDTKYFQQVQSDQIQLRTNLDTLRITWIGKDGTVLYDNDNNAGLLENHLNRPEVRAAFQSGIGECVRKSDTMDRNTFYYAILLSNGTVLRVATEARNLVSVFFTTAPFILLIIVIIVGLCILLTKILTKQLIDPIEEMASDLENINEEHAYKELIPFVHMIRQQHADILSAAKMRQDFTANVSHELKTPLTAISGYAELLENDMVGPDQEKHFLTEIRNNANRLLSLINDIIRLSELDHHISEPQFEELELGRIVEDSLEALRIAAQKRKVKLNYNKEKCIIRGNREMIHEVVENLVQNAIRYNIENGTVEINIRKEKGCVLLEVKDTGIGIPKDDQQRVFERFYRVDKSRSKQTGGTGLGLAIVKHIAQIHDAKIELVSELEKGTTVTLIF